MKIRKARKTDAPILSDIAIRAKAYWPYDQAFLDLCKLDLQVSSTQAASGNFFVAESEGEIVGFYSFSCEQVGPLMTDLFVDPRFIGKGVGLKLWRHALEFAHARGWTYFEMDADPFAADKFYYRVGCKKVGETESTVLKGRLLPRLRFDLAVDDKIEQK